VSERKKFLLRISPELWDELNRWASQEFRSVNGQIEFILQRAVDARLRKGRGREPIQDPKETRVVPDTPG
jgi:hypothetical protein